MEKIFADVETHSTEYLQWLTRAVAQPSISAEGVGLEEMAGLLAELLEGIGFQVEQVADGGPPVVLATMKGQGPRTLLFYNHYDVQPVDPLDEWTSPPFTPTRREGKLYGRGAADDKGPLIARLAAVASYLRVRQRLPVSLTWVIEGEEESGSDGLRRFAEARKEALQAVFGCVWESGGKNAAGRYEMTLGCKGILCVELATTGAAHDLHSAHAAIVPSPAWRLLWALNSLKGPDERIRIPGFYDDVRPLTPAQRQALADWDYPEEKNLALHGIDGFLGGLTGQQLKEQIILGNTCNINGFCTGYNGVGAKTVLPREASARLDLRLVPDQRPERVIELLRAHLQAEGFGDVEIVHWEGEMPATSDPEHPFVQAAARAAGQIFGRPPAILPTMGGSGPMHLLCGQFGVPVVSAGVSYEGSNVHAPEENIRLDDFTDGIRYVAALLGQFE